MVENVGKLFQGSGLQHGDARLAEVGDTLKQRCGGQMPAYVQDAAVLVDAVD